MKYIFTLIFLFICSLVFSQDCDLLSISNNYPITRSPTCGQANGSIEVRAVGNGNVEYSLDGGPFQSSGLFTNLIDATYIIEYRDSQGCSDTIEVTLEAEEPVRIQSVDTQNSSCDTNNGSITVNATGPNLLYSLNGTDFQTSNQFTNLGPRNYKVYVKDKNDCQVTRQVTIRRGSINLTRILVEKTACTQSNGRITVDASGDNLEYRLNGVRDWQSSNIFSNLGVGEYQVQIRDAEGCVVSRNVNVGINLDYDITVNHTDCNTENGQITVAVNTPGNYDFSLDGGPFQTSNSFHNLGEGSYRITIRDNNGGCELSENVTVDTRVNINNFEVTTSSTSCGSSSGTISASAQGSGLVFSISGPGGNFTNTSGNFNNLSEGEYNVTVTDASGCALSELVNVESDNDINDNPDIDLNFANCNVSNGSLTITATAASGGLEYSLNGGPFQTSGTFNNIPSEIYTVTARSAANCTRDFIIEVPEVNDISVYNVVLDAPTFRCSGDGRIVVEATGSNVEYSIDGVNFSSSGVFEGLDAGTYIVYMTNEFGCTRQTGDLELVSSFSIIDILIDTANCFENNGVIEMLVGGDGLMYSLDGGEPTPNHIFENLFPGTYDIEITDENGCKIETNIEVPNEGWVEIDEISTVSTFCGDPNGQLSFTTRSESDSIEYSIDGQNYQADSLFVDLPAGPITVYARDEFGCVATASAEIPGSSPIVPDYLINPTACDFNNGSITISPKGGVGRFIYSIDNGPFQSVPKFEGLSERDYMITIQDEVGCVIQDSVSVGFDCKVLFPSAYAPNENGKNEIYRAVYYIPYQVNKFMVFNSWGELIHHTIDFNSSNNSMWWNGKDAQTGEYLAYMEYELDGEVKTLSKTFLLLK